MFEYIESGQINLFNLRLEEIKSQGDLKLSEMLSARNSLGQTLLHVAVQKGLLDVVRELLFLGIAREEKDSEGRTPLSIAETSNYPKIAALLRTHIQWQSLNDSSFSISKLLHYIEKAFVKIKSGKDKNLVLVIGNTGAGKSTLLNYLLGARYSIKKIKKEFLAELISGKELARVGYSNTVSQTLDPHAFNCEGKDYVLCDLAGFGDSRGKQKAICAATSTQMLINQSKKIKSIILVLSFDDLIGSRAQAFKQVCSALYNVLRKDMKLVSSSLHFVFTKAENYTVDEIFSKYINEILDHKEEGLIVKEKILSEDEKGLYAVLMAMRANKHKILIPDISDEGVSAATMFTAIDDCIPFNKKECEFMSHDVNQNNFNKLILNFAREFLHRVNATDRVFPKLKQSIIEKINAEQLKVASIMNEMQYKITIMSTPFDSRRFDGMICEYMNQQERNKAMIRHQEFRVQMCLDGIVSSETRLEDEHRWIRENERARAHHLYAGYRAITDRNIARANEHISRCREMIKESSDIIVKGKQQNEEILRVIEKCKEALSAERYAYQQKVQVIEAEIKECQRLIEQSTSTLKALTSELEVNDRKLIDLLLELEVNYELFKMVYDVIKALSLKDVDDSQLTEKFIQSFEAKIKPCSLPLDKLGFFSSESAKKNYVEALYPLINK